MAASCSGSCECIFSERWGVGTSSATFVTAQTDPLPPRSAHEHPHRERMRTHTGVGLTLLLGALAWSSTRQRQRIPFVDSHIHLNSPDSAVALLNLTGVTHAIVFIG